LTKLARQFQEKTISPQSARNIQRFLIEGDGRLLCPLCSSPKSKSIQQEPVTTDQDRSSEFRDRWVSLVSCSECRFEYVRRDFPPEYLASYYTLKAGGGTSLNREHFGWWLQATEYSNRQILSAVRDWFPGPLLDVGCGWGITVWQAQLAGWKAVGVEINELFCQFMTRDLKLETIQGAVETVIIPAGSYAVISMLDFLEHTYDPVSILRRCAEWLRPGGVIIIKVPHGPIQLQKEKLKKYLGIGTGYVANIGHINQFTARTLEFALERAGLHMETVTPAQVFVPGIRGASFRPLLFGKHYGIRALNAATTFLHNLGGLNLGFNLLGLAKKPEGQNEQ
jgi:2-polyprenyl-3-methyl-5-hydroxy-6-metoxy-1,4-benzoquinol methylase